MVILLRQPEQTKTDGIFYVMWVFFYCNEKKKEKKDISDSLIQVCWFIYVTSHLSSITGQFSYDR